MKKLIPFLILLFCFTSTSVFATDYYITQNGTGDGSSYAQAASIADFNAGVLGELDGDIIYLCDNITTIVSCPDSGSNGNNITIRGDYSGHPGVLDGNDINWVCFRPTSAGNGIAVSYVTLTYLTFRNVDVVGGSGRYISLTNLSNNIVIDHCTFDSLTDVLVDGDDDDELLDNYGAYAIYAPNCNNFTVTNCDFTNITGHDVIYWNGDTSTFTGNSFLGGCVEGAVIKLSGENTINGSSGNTIVAYNYFYQTNKTSDYELEFGDGHCIGAGGSVTSKQNVQNIYVYENEINDCGTKGTGGRICFYNVKSGNISYNYIHNGGDKGITLGNSVQNVIVSYNQIEDNTLLSTDSDSSGMLEIKQAAGGCETCTSIEDLYIFNNIIANNDDASPESYRAGVYVWVANIEGYEFKNIYFKNNIVSKNMQSCGSYGYAVVFSWSSTPVITNVNLDYNDVYQSSNLDTFMYYGTTSYKLSHVSDPDWDDYKIATSQDSHSINSDPLFNSGTYTLSASSPAINAGTDLGDDYDQALNPDSEWPNSVQTNDQDDYGAGWEIGAYIYGTSTMTRKGIVSSGAIFN